MRLDCRNPEFHARNLGGTLVEDLLRGAPIRKVVWADDVTGEFEAWACDEAGRRILFSPGGRRVAVEEEFHQRVAVLLGGGQNKRIVWDDGCYCPEARPRTYRGRTRLRITFPYDSNPPRVGLLLPAGVAG